MSVSRADRYNGFGIVVNASVGHNWKRPAAITDAIRPNGVALDLRHIYWTNGNGTIGRANLDGTGV